MVIQSWMESNQNQNWRYNSSIGGDWHNYILYNRELSVQSRHFSVQCDFIGYGNVVL